MRWLTGCLTKLVLWGAAAAAFVWLVIVVMNPWALHIGGRSTPLLYWHGWGRVAAKDGKTYPLYIYFSPGRPLRGHIVSRREGKRMSADLHGMGWLCIAPGTTELMNLSGTMYGGYTSSDDSLFTFRLLEWRKPYQINYPYRGFFDLTGMWHGQELVMDRPGEQGIPFKSGMLIDNAKVTLHWANFQEFEAACRAMR